MSFRRFSGNPASSPPPCRREPSKLETSQDFGLWNERAGQCLHSPAKTAHTGLYALRRRVSTGQLSEIYINDLDKQIYSFWKAVLNHTDEFIELLHDTPVSVRQWRRQKVVLKNSSKHSLLEVGFATFYVNRCNRSGVLNAGPIGGIDQSGNYGIDVRFNKEELQQRIEKIALYRDRITVKNLDGIAFLNWLFIKRALDPKVCLVYMDPPYFEKASTLYDVYFRDSNHRELAQYLAKRHAFRWVVSYDDVAVIRSLYKDRLNILSVNYSAHSARIGRELIISSSNCKLPQDFWEKQVRRDVAPFPISRAKVQSRA